MCAQYGDNVLPHRVEWTEIFKNDHTGVTDAKRLSRPTITTTAQNEARYRELTLKNRKVTVDKTA
jgi:hypothetical protein